MDKINLDLKKLDMFIFKRNCGRCQYNWFPRSQSPKRCPKCQIWLWSDNHNEDGEVLKEIIKNKSK